jgi:tetratricopeptide (TPR) repeat protein
MHTVPGLFERLTTLYADGERAIEEGRFHDAVALFTEGIRLDDQFRQHYVTMYAQRAFARQRIGDNMGAIPDYGKAIEMEPPMNQAQYYFHRGMCFTAIGGHEEHAVADYGRSIAIFPDHPGPYHLRGKLYASDLGRYEEAVADFNRLLAMRPVVAPDDELFYRSMQAVLAADPATYRSYFLDNSDFARFRNQPRFHQIVGTV